MTIDESAISPRSLGESHGPLRLAVTDAIRDRIIDGIHPPGERLLEEAIAAELGVSRNPVREAFQSLASEGFVVLEPRRGAKVASIDTRRAAEIFEVREALEALVAELAATRGTQESIARLHAIVAEGQAVAETGDLSRLPHLNTQFHAHLTTMAGNELLTTLFNQVSGIIRWIYAERLEERVRSSWHEHTGMADAVASGDPERSQRLAREHVASARDAYFAGRD